MRPLDVSHTWCSVVHMTTTRPTPAEIDARNAAGAAELARKAREGREETARRFLEQQERLDAEQEAADREYDRLHANDPEYQAEMARREALHARMNKA